MLNLSDLKDEIINVLKDEQPKCNVILMPHFCIDNYIKFEGDYKSFVDKIEKIVEQGGGNIIVHQSLHSGGKALNTASALSALGINAYLLARTDSFGYDLLKHFLCDSKVDISYMKTDGELAITSAIELTDSNIMLSYPASLSQFGPECLSDNDWKLLGEVDLVVISDFGLNNKGKELAREVFSFVKEKGKGKTFFDPGDPSPKGLEEKEEIKGVKNIIEDGLIDILSVNEDEVERYGGASFLRRWTRVDLHTSEYAMSFYRDSQTNRMPVFDINPKILTGAGDAWSAGDIYGELVGFGDESRLFIANAVAGFYVSNQDGRHPTISDLLKFIKITKLK